MLLDTTARALWDGNATPDAPWSSGRVMYRAIMFRFSPGDEAVIFLDCFGVTRLQLPKKVKTDRKVRGTWGSLLSLSDGGEQAMVYDQQWWRTYAYEFPALKPSHKYDRFEWQNAQVLGDGEHMLVEHEIVRTLEGTQTGKVKGGTAKVLPPLDLWATHDLGYYVHEAFPEGSLNGGAFARVHAPKWTWFLSWGRCDRRGGAVAWRRPLEAHGGHRHGMFPHAQGLVLTSLSPKLRQVRGQWLDAEGTPGPSLEREGVTVPVWSHGRIAWQADEDTVVVVEADGQEERYSISDATRRAHGVSTHPRALPKGDFLGDLENTGDGAVLLGERAVLFVPWHCETILDLVAGTEVHRKLPAAEYEPRRVFRQIVRRAAAFARDADITVDGGYCMAKTKDRTYDTGFSVTRGEGGLVGLMVGSGVESLFHNDPAAHYVDDWRWSGGSGGAGDYLSGTFGEDDLLRAFQIFDDHRMHLYWAKSGLERVYARRLGLDTLGHHGETPGPVLTKDAEKLLMQALLMSAAQTPDSHEPKGRSSESASELIEHTRAWRAASLDKASFLKQAEQVENSDVENGLLGYLARSYFDDGPFVEE